MLDKKTTAVVTAIQLFDILDHIHCEIFQKQKPSGTYLF